MDRADPYLPIISKMPAGYHGLEFKKLLEVKENTSKKLSLEWYKRYQNEVHAHRRGLATDPKKQAKENEAACERAAARRQRHCIWKDLMAYQRDTRRPRTSRRPPPPPPCVPERCERCAPCTTGGMRPATAADKVWLGIGCEHDGDARAKYMELRYEDWPWDRWCYPASVNMEYLWAPHLGVSQQGPCFPRRGGHLEKGFFRRRNVAVSTGERPDALCCFRRPLCPPVL